MIGSARNTIAVGLAAVLGAVPLHAISGDARLLWLVPWLVAALQGIAYWARRRGRRPWLPNTAQLVALVVAGWVSASVLIGGLEREAPWRPLVLAARQAGRHIAEERAPMPPDDATLLVLLAGVGVLCVLIDLFFIAARSALLAVLPLLAGYLTSAIVLDQAQRWWSLVAVVAGWLVLLASRTIDHDRRWPRGLAGAGVVSRPDWSAFGGLVARLGVPAVAVALVAGLTVPAAGRPDWWPEAGQNNTVQLTDPTIELNENLRRPEDRPVLTYQTATGVGLYLRSSTLTLVDAAGWGQIDMELLPGFPARVPGRTGILPDLTTRIDIGEFNSNYLPVPYAPVRWDAEGDWLYDPVSLTVLGVEQRGQAGAVAGLSYTVESISAEPTVNQVMLARAGVPPDGEVASQLPGDLPPEIVELAQQVSAGATTDGERAIALQEFLRNPDLFSYNLSAPAGVGHDVLVNFLFHTRAGYCVHFSAAMGVMARALGIPSRVAVGFTPGTQQADGSWLVTSHNMHAWPELYFAGLGWVRFEPTVGVGAEPSYTQIPDAQDPPTPSAEPLPSEEPTEEPTIEPTLGPEEQPGPIGGGAGTIDLRWLLGVAGALLALLVPAGTRALRRWLRLRAGEPDALVRGAWAELRDSALDLGLDWPGGITPRQLAGAEWPGLDGAGRAALGRLALLTEQLRFAPALPDEVSVVDDLAVVRGQWAAQASGGQRFAARFAPRSLVSFAAGTPDEVATPGGLGRTGS